MHCGRGSDRLLPFALALHGEATATRGEATATRRRQNVWTGTPRPRGGSWQPHPFQFPSSVTWTDPGSPHPLRNSFCLKYNPKF